MARFELVEIDYDQTGFGEGHAVPELQAQLPGTAKLTRRFSGPDRDDYFLAILEQPIKYHPPRVSTGPEAQRNSSRPIPTVSSSGYTGSSSPA